MKNVTKLTPPFSLSPLRQTVLLGTGRAHHGRCRRVRNRQGLPERIPQYRKLTFVEDLSPKVLIPSFVMFPLPRQGNCSRSSPHSNGSESTERFSRKVFVGGLPPDIDEGKCSCFNIVSHSIEHERNTCFNLHVRTHTHNPELRGEIWTRRLSSGTCVPGHAPAKGGLCELGEMEIHLLPSGIYVAIYYDDLLLWVLSDGKLHLSQQPVRDNLLVVRNWHIGTVSGFPLLKRTEKAISYFPIVIIPGTGWKVANSGFDWKVN